MNILTGLEAVPEIMHECILTENNPDGILHDVEQIITTDNNENGVNEPCIWINQHPTIVAPNSKTTLSNDITLLTPFEFVCIEYDPDDEISAKKGQNLASRVVLAISKNYQRIQKEQGYGERVIHDLQFYMFYPVGKVQILGKSEKVPATSVTLNVLHRIEWLKCCKRMIKEENENNGD